MDGNETVVHAEMEDFPPRQLGEIVKGVVGANLSAVEEEAVTTLKLASLPSYSVRFRLRDRQRVLTEWVMPSVLLTNLRKDVESRVTALVAWAERG